MPKTEAGRKQRYQSDIKLTAITGLLAECLSVAQLGWSKPIVGPPRRSGDEVVLPLTEGRSEKGRISGSTRQPSEISYRENEPAGQSINVTMDYSDGAIIISRTFGTHVIFQARYRILAFKPNCPVDDFGFSWRAYKDSAGNVLGTLLTNGATMEVSFTNGSFRPTRLLATSRPMPHRSEAFIFLLFTLVTVGAAIFAWKVRKTRSHNNKT